MPLSITDVGIRAKQNFLYNPIKYGEYPAGTVLLVADAAREFQKRYPDYDKIFHIKETVYAKEPFIPIGKYILIFGRLYPYTNDTCTSREWSIAKPRSCSTPSIILIHPFYP